MKKVRRNHQKAMKALPPALKGKFNRKFRDSTEGRNISTEGWERINNRIRSIIHQSRQRVPDTEKINSIIDEMAAGAHREHVINDILDT